MYQLHWITEHLATGHAPMSYEDLDSIRAQGIRAIVNLCGEFCDLHQIEESSGFEVYYLPVTDECAPDLDAMEKALDWMDEAIYLDKKVLVHCRMGQGRTGTFIAAYLLRRGFDFKRAEKTMKGRIANPATYAQRRFLKDFGKQAGPLQTASPKIDNRPSMDVAPVLHRYQELVARYDRLNPVGDGEDCCGQGNHPCCAHPFDLLLIESIHFSQAINRDLTHVQRRAVVERAIELARHLKELHHHQPGLSTDQLVAGEADGGLICPLVEAGRCLVFTDRPPRCRYWQNRLAADDQTDFDRAVVELSGEAYRILTGGVAPAGELRFSSADTISGKFVQLYFQAMTGRNNG